MSTEVLLTKHLGNLTAHDPISAETLQEIRQGETVKATITRPRNLRFHKKFMALMNVVFKSQSRYPTLKQVVNFFKASAGHGEFMEAKGKTVFIPDSISFAKLDETGFTSFYNKAIEVLIRDLLPGVKSDDLKRRVEEILEGNAG